MTTKNNEAMNMSETLNIPEKDSDMNADIKSISSDASTIPPPPYHESSTTSGFRNPIPDVRINPSTVLTIRSQGTSCIRLPTPSRELEIAVFNGTDISAEPAYVSTRAKRSAGNAILRHFVKGDLLSTTYKFGPFREPEIRHVGTSLDGKSDKPDEQGNLAVKLNASVRSVTFSSVPDGTKSFTWEYKKTNTADGKRKVIILSMKELNAHADWRKDKILAALVRTDETRTPGSSKRSAGNGGQLLIDSEATMHLNEEMIVATCLMMLKKEIDRQRMIQAAVIAGGASGGGG